MHQLGSKKFFLSTLAIAGCYLVATVYLMNYRLVTDAMFGAHSIGYRWNLLVALLGGMWTAMSTLNLALLVTVAMLTGANLTLTVQRLHTLRSAGKIRVMVGGSSLLGIVGSGCASCSLPVLALLGLSGAVAYLPLQGVELSLLAVLLLSVSLYSLIRGGIPKATCAVQPVK